MSESLKNVYTKSRSLQHLHNDKAIIDIIILQSIYVMAYGTVTSCKVSGYIHMIMKDL